ncbi:MAG: single-stranded DNA-binding protein [Bacteroidales bacterium]
MSVNKVILVGNVGKDPETRYLDEGTAMTKFPLATSENYRNREGQRVENTEWHNIVLWRGLAQVAEKYVKKGTQLYIEGRIKTRSYEDSDGNRKYITEIVGDQMQMLGKRQDDEGDQSGQASSRSEQSQQASSRSEQSQQSSSRSEQSQQSSPQQSRSQQAPGEYEGTRQSESPSTGQKGPSDSEGHFNSEDEEPDDLPF